MNRFVLISTILFVAIGSFCLLNNGCSRSQNANASTNMPVRMEPALAPNLIEVSHPEEFPLVKAVARRVHDDLLVSGVVAPDVSRTVPVNSLAGGRVIEIRARLGDFVHKGQVLLRIHSYDLAQAIADYQKAQADEALARSSLLRAEDLYEHGALAEKDKQQAEDTEQKSRVDVKTAEERIRLLGGDINHLSPILKITAPISGTIVEQNITDGAGVKSLDSSPNLFTIADLSHVWVLCDVYENDLSKVRVGDIADVRLNAYPDRQLRGRVSNIAAILDPTTRTAKVRLELENRGGLMRPGMFATAKFISGDAKDRVFVPAAAILRLHDKDWVFRPKGGRLFLRTEVQAGPATGDGSQELLTGIEPGDSVVANALQFSSTAEQQ